MRLVSIFCVVAVSGLAQQPNPPQLRLDGSLVPIRYRLDLTVVPEAERFSGTIEIDAKLAKPTSLLWLNATDLTIDTATIRTRSREWSARTTGTGKDFLGLQTPEPVPAGQVLLRIRYSAPFNRKGDVSGLFVLNDAGASYAYTDLEPFDARRVVPSFDEPSYKVPWSVTLHVPREHKAFANTASISETEEANGLKAVRFAETKPLPTYLVCLAVGPFETLDLGSAGRAKTPLRLIVPRGRAEHTAFTKQITPRLFTVLEDYFGIPYPYDKLDQIAVPTTAMGAMENAGLITYAENLLVAPASGDSVQRQRNSAAVIAHEIAHHWFGNLVTTAWWDDIWLNEAFASWMEVEAVHRVFPEWRAPVQAQVSKAVALRNDSLASARQVRQPVETVGDIGQAFDSITYLKGSAVIRMFENYLGPEVFRKGVQIYLRKHAWRNATSRDFLAGLSLAAGRDIAPAFSTFLNRSGFPLLRVGLDCAGGVPQVSISQDRYVPLGSKAARDMSWQVPVCLKYGKGTDVGAECALITDPRQKLPLKQAKTCPAWLFADQNGAGYYRVLYEGRLQQQLTATALPSLSLAERVSLLRSVQALLADGLIAPGDALTLAARFADSPEFEIAASAAAIAGSVETYVPRNLRDNYARFITRTFGPRVRRLGWIGQPEEDPEVRLLRPAVLGLVANTGRDPVLAAEAKRLAVIWLKDRSVVERGLAFTLLRSAAEHGDRDLFEQFLRAAESSTVLVDRASLVFGIGGFKDPSIVKDALNWMLDGNVSVLQTRPLLNFFAMREETLPIVWDYLTANYDKLVARIPSRSGIDTGTTLMSTAWRFCDAAGRAKAEQFFGERAKKLQGGPREFAAALETIDQCIARRAALEQPLAEFLKDY